MPVKCTLCFDRNIKWSQRDYPTDHRITQFEVHGSQFIFMDDG
jgi:hypothetical protein